MFAGMTTPLSAWPTMGRIPMEPYGGSMRVSQLGRPAGVRLGALLILVLVLALAATSCSNNAAPHPAKTATQASASSYAVPAVREALTTSSASPVVHDNEVMALAAQSGRLFAATDQWEYSGPSAYGQVLVKNSASSPWQVFEQTQSTRVQALDSFPIPADQGLGSGHSLLVTQAIVNGRSQIQWLIDGANSFSPADSYVLPGNAQVRSFGAHEDDGTWAVYAGIDPTGILRGTWSPARHTLVFGPAPELTAAPPKSLGLKTQKVTAFADCGGALYVSVNTKLYRRNDGALAPGAARWVLVYQEPPVGPLNSGLRGLTCVSHDGSPSLLLSSEGTGNVYRLDHLPHGQLDAPVTGKPGQMLTPVLEFSPVSAIRRMLAAYGAVVPATGRGSINYVIAAYNNFETAGIGGVTRQLFGIEWGYDQGCPAARICAPSGFDAAACFGVRTDQSGSPTYVLRCLSGPQFQPSRKQPSPVRSGQAFVSVRTVVLSPFGDGRIYYGGYDNDFSPADGAAWIASSTMSALRLPQGAHPSSAAASASGWVKDTVHALDIFLPDANSDYYLDGFGTKNGYRTVITGKVPRARYWSFTAYPPTGPGREVHDTQIAQSRGRYTVVIAASCVGIKQTCIATSSAVPAGVVVMRLYVPVDLNGEGTGGVPLPAISYTNAAGTPTPASLTQASGTPQVGNQIGAYRQLHGALPADLTRAYPPATPVVTPVNNPPPVGLIAHGEGRFNNPDNAYDHVPFTTARGNLVISAQAPTYQEDSFARANDLGRPADRAPQVRYWSLCIILTGLHTGACLRDEQIRFPAGSDRFTAIISPTCPVAGYLNCLTAGPQPLQVSLAYRLLLPDPAFAARAFHGSYALTATYVKRPR